MINQHARRVIDAYLDAPVLAVPHAILIGGPWGAGKTYFLQNVYEPERRERVERAGHGHVPFLFVSLFGAVSAADVELRIFKTANPGEAIAGSLAGNITLGIGEFLRLKDTSKAIVDAVGKRAIKRLRDFVFVFDDLERVEPKAFGEVMGLVNALISEHGRRVILVADESKIAKLAGDGRWSEQNEKRVGRRAQIEADVEGVLNFAMQEMADGPAKVMIDKNLVSLRQVALASGVKNLRNLRWAMHNAVAFVTCLVTDPEIPELHVKITMEVVFATTLWLRSGGLTSGDLLKVPGLSMKMAIRSVNKSDAPLDDETRRAKGFSDTFSFLNVGSPPVDYPFISEFEASGVLDTQRLIEWVKSQFGFGITYSEPTWRTLWHSHERGIAVTNVALAVLERELRDRKYDEVGEILHCAGLSIKFSKANYPQLTGGENVLEFFKTYVDDMFSKGRLKGERVEFSRMSFDSFGGLGFSSVETAEFREIASYLAMRTVDVAQANLVKLAETIFGDAEAGNLEAIFEFVRTENYDLAKNPVLNNIAPERLASLMLQDAPALTAGAKLLSYRYHEAREGDPLLREIGWARSVYSHVESGIQAWGEPHASLALERLQGLLRHYEQERRSEDRILPIKEG